MAGFEQAAPLPVAGGILGAPVNCPAASTTGILLIPLTAGVWLVTVSIDIVFAGAALTLIEAQIQAGTATVIFTGGPIADGVEMGNASGGVGQGELTMQTVATVTAAGSLQLAVKNPSGTTAATVAASSGSFAGSSGWTAVRIG
ncbi:MAG TPA: hypothetical protein VLS51_08565 [Propionibacteriaceae bacterium]|nr:hypothetical protein [Propionibacteriaceae bacterium]